MKLKSIFATLVLVAGVNQLNAQFMRAGINFANISISNDGDVDKNKMLPGFQAGISADIKLANAIYLQPGLMISGKGAKTSQGNTNGNTYFKATTNPYYVEIPANLVFKAPGEAVNIFVGAGPYLAIGIAGKNKIEGKFLGASFQSEDNIKWSDDDPSTFDYEEGAGFGIMRRFDYGVNALAGLEFRQTIIAINYGLGLAKLQSGSNNQDNDNNKHRVLSLTVGFKF